MASDAIYLSPSAPSCQPSPSQIVWRPEKPRVGVCRERPPPAVPSYRTREIPSLKKKRNKETCFLQRCYKKPLKKTFLSET